MTIVSAPNPHRLPARSGAVQAVVIHQTGSDNLTRVLDYYTNRNGANDDGVSPHYTVASDGTVYQHVSEEMVAYHTAIRPAARLLYRAGYQYWSNYVWDSTKRTGIDCGEEQSRYRTWRQTWKTDRGLESPLELPTGESPNWASVGIELLSPVKPWPEYFTLPQYESLAELVGDVCLRHKVSVDRLHILGHSDCNPLERSDGSGLNDPGERFKWGRLWDLMHVLSEMDTDPNLAPAS